MKKIMYLFSFLAFMTASNLNAQSTACNEICPPGCCILDCDVSKCTPAQIAACKAMSTKATAIKADAETETPKAIQANFVLEEKAAKTKTACCALFGNNKPASCKKSPTKATKVAYQAEKKATCSPAKSTTSKKMTCGNAMK